MFFYSISLIGLLLVSCLVQPFLPAISGWYDARFLILPLIVVCGSVTVSTGIMLILAFLGGFLWDAQQILSVSSGDPLVYSQPSDSLKFGYSIVLYTLMGLLMQGVRPLFRKGNWPLSAILTGVAIFLYLFVEYLLRGFIIGGLQLNEGILKQLGATAVMTMTLSPFVFWLLYKVARLCGHTFQAQTR